MGNTGSSNGGSNISRRMNVQLSDLIRVVLRVEVVIEEAVVVVVAGEFSFLINS